jgi:hypothetical protein
MGKNVVLGNNPGVDVDKQHVQFPVIRPAQPHVRPHICCIGYTQRSKSLLNILKSLRIFICTPPPLLGIIGRCKFPALFLHFAQSFIVG